MIVTFHTQAWADVTMFGDVAVRLLRLMGHSGTVPGAIEPADIPAALERLRAAIAESGNDDDEQPESGDTSDDDQEPQVSLARRAFPLIQLLEAAHRESQIVSWSS